jgi:hypothetical protein
MNENWLEVSDENVNVEDIMRQIRERVARHGDVPPPGEAERPEAVAENLWKEMIGDTADGPASQPISIRQRDCDITPRYYVIDWRIPILGPIHAIVRRIINAEIRRYLFSSLEKQSRFNRQVLKALTGLAQENARLQQEIEELAGKRE